MNSEKDRVGSTRRIDLVRRYSGALGHDMGVLMQVTLQAMNIMERMVFGRCHVHILIYAAGLLMPFSPYLTLI